MKYEITLDKNLLDNKDIDFFHYKQSYELAKCELGTFYITSCGELKCEFTNEEKGIQTRNYDDIVRYYVRNNNEYLQAVGMEEENNVGDLYIDLGNWFSLELIRNGNRYYEVIDSYDLVYGSISECLENFKDLMQDEQFINDLKEEIRGK
jgi:hypothetical protein